jgi:DHA2 family multidrug resistance protein
VDLHVLKDRNLRTGCVLVAMLGMCIYITIAILPLYYQEIMGYTAFTAGLVVGPRGVGSFIGSFFIGYLGSRIDNRKLMTIGFVGFAACALVFGTVNLSIGPFTLLVPVMLTGFALAFVFVPLSTLMMSTITNKNMGAATGLANMLRNIGGSVGIAMATTALIRRSALHQSHLAANLTATSPELQRKSAMIATYLGHRIGSPGARSGSFGLLYGLMQQQSALLAYVDVFRWTALLAVVCAAAAWMFKKPTKHSSASPDLH